MCECKKLCKIQEMFPHMPHQNQNQTSNNIVCGLRRIQNSHEIQHKAQFTIYNAQRTYNMQWNIKSTSFKRNKLHWQIFIPFKTVLKTQKPVSITFYTRFQRESRNM